MLTSRTILLLGHIAAAVLFIGPFTVASSAFPRQIKAADNNPVALGAAAELHRMSKVYGTTSLAVPVFGMALAAHGKWWEHAWLQIAIGLTAGWVALWFAAILPLQRQAMTSAQTGDGSVDSVVDRIHTFTGLHAVLWVATLWLMVAKPAW